MFIDFYFLTKWTLRKSLWEWLIKWMKANIWVVEILVSFVFFNPADLYFSTVILYLSQKILYLPLCYFLFIYSIHSLWIIYLINFSYYVGSIAEMQAKSANRYSCISFTSRKQIKNARHIQIIIQSLHSNRILLILENPLWYHNLEIDRTPHSLRISYSHSLQFPLQPKSY